MTIHMAAIGALALAQQVALPEYASAIRCAGLVEAGDELVADEAASKPLFDAAIFWGLAASERARKDGVSTQQFKADQERARAKALDELKREDPGAGEEIIDCVMRVPKR